MGANQRSQVVMPAAEVEELVAASRTAVLATVGPGGQPHLVAMWYAIVDGDICFETKAKSQKAVNLRRDPRVSCLIEDGVVYEQLRGVSFEGTAELSDDPGFLWQIGVSIVERYYGPYSEEMRPFVENMLAKRVGVRLRPERVRSWDHARLGLPPTGEPGGTTATAARRPR